MSCEDAQFDFIRVDTFLMQWIPKTLVVIIDQIKDDERYFGIMELMLERRFEQSRSSFYSKYLFIWKGMIQYYLQSIIGIRGRILSNQRGLMHYGKIKGIGDLVWVYLRKARFPSKRRNKLMPRAEGLFKVVSKN